MFIHPNIKSSYALNFIGESIYQVIYALKPNKVIEFGVLHGYSLICIAQALRDIGKGYVIGYDLWDDYPFKHGDIKKVYKLLKKENLDKFVILKKKCLFDWLKNPENFDILHIDVSNDGLIIKEVVKKLETKLLNGAILIFEGGIYSRDKVEWMQKFNKCPILPLKKKIGYKIINHKFPGLSIIDRRNKLQFSTDNLD